MKASTTIAVVVLAISINSTAQVKIKERGVPPKPATFVPRDQAQNQSQQNHGRPDGRWGPGMGSAWGPGSSYGSVTIGFGNYPNYNSYNNFNSYNSYNIRKATKYSIRAAGQIIDQAVAFDSWNDIYSPLLAKAIRHYNYSRQLYWWGNYQAAYNHAERARYLAWYSLQYFQNPGCGGNYGGGYAQPDPYSDPYNPYYRSNQTNGTTPNPDMGNRTQEIPKMEELDKKLPGSDANDREVIKSFDKTELKDE
jgi:hypothetical protein